MQMVMFASTYNVYAFVQSRIALHSADCKERAKVAMIGTE